MKTCPNCGRENADDARFCSQCATSLEAQVPAREERKVVTCLFCDLVGFTARAESMDPEDVRRLLQPYHAQVRSELERFGGTVEKFIGDAVMAVFGAPVAHEDDPERAVRAALSIRDKLAEQGELEVRIGITTGEALVALDARPQAGEGMASGDVVNTAARLQSAASPGAILVDETTFRATERAIELEEALPVDAKGKSSPVPVWEALRARARVAVERTGGAALVGREEELALLRGTLTRVVRERASQLVTLVGVPGIGKSRLVFELFQTIETGEHGLVFWRHGRSLPYGDGVTFWALREMVKAQAGILESDSGEQAGQKLREAVERFIDDPADAGWIERHVRPLAGLETDDAGAGDRRDESFAAWRRLLEAIADERPLVLVFEDLHWADDVLLDFVDYLVEWASGVPILVLATARPELLSRRPGWGGGKVNSSTILLSPLTLEETTRLLHALLGRSALDADLQTRLLEHAGGNPLYAEEFTRMLVSRPGEVVLPETVQGVISARLDTLPSEEKALLQDAAVIGRTFWLGALGRERWALEGRLHSLARKEFVSRNRRSSVAGEDEYTFRHALVRDVAYEQIPRAQRADKHLVAAEWTESLGRTEDHAEMLAHHYLSALELSQAAGDPIADIAEKARDVLRDAGDRASSLSSFGAAARFYENALAVGVLDDGDRADLTFRRARALNLSGDEGAGAALEEARDALLETGDSERAAEADGLLADFWRYRGSRDRQRQHLDRAHALVDDLPPSAGKAHVLSQVSRYDALAGKSPEAIRVGREALAMAEELGLDEIRAHALINIALAKNDLGDPTSMEDLERSIEIALAVRSSEAARAYNNLGVFVWQLGEFRRACALFDEAVATGERLGNAPIARFARGMQLFHLFEKGEWEDGLARADAFLAACEAGEPHYLEAGIRRMRAHARLAQDDTEGALREVPRVLQAARGAGDPQVIVPALVSAARLYAESGWVADAKPLAREALATSTNSFWLIGLASVADELACSTELRQTFEVATPTGWTEAALAELRGDFAAAAIVYDEMGVLFSEAFARSRAAGLLVAEGRRTEADEQLRRSLAFWRSVGATRYIREGESLLAMTA